MSLGPLRRPTAWPRSSRPSAPRRRSTRTSNTSRGSRIRDARRKDSGQPRRRHDDGDAPRRPPGRPDLLPAPVVRTDAADEGRREEISAYDGERTRTVIAGNCANIHLGRFEHPDISPAHSLPLAHPRQLPALGLPERDRGDPRLSQVSLEERVESGWLDGYSPGSCARFEGEEAVDGLRCLKVRVDRWYRPGHTADRRNTSGWPPSGTTTASRSNTLGREMHVDELREVAPGVWFPTRITVSEVQFQGPRTGEEGRRQPDRDDRRRGRSRPAS